MKLPEPVRKIVEDLADLPSIGPRQATRLAFHLIGKGKPAIGILSEDLTALAKIGICERCFFVHQNENGLCDICANPARDQGIIMVIERETDYVSVENTNKFTGRYFILGPISRTGLLDGTQKLRLQNLQTFIIKELNGKAKEIILGFNTTSAGDFNASIILKELSTFAEKTTRLGRGLPTGGEIEFADDETLGSALQGRS